MADSSEEDQAERRGPSGRRSFFRGGRRQSDWPESLTVPLRCPRCQSSEARFVDGTPDTLFWECHRCRHPWSTTPEGHPSPE
jgi:hypothetical protein